MRAADGDNGGVLADVPLDAILGEAARFTGEVLAPLNRVGDREGVRLKDGAVTTAPGWKEAYRRFAEAGWTGVSAPEQYGGQGLPVMVEMAVQEMWNAGAAAFAVGPMLTVGAIEALAAHGAAEIRATYLPRLVAGRWTATMNLTEPQAGSDLGLVATRATRAEDGTYRISGQKIFITYGEHDLAENIVHLVLARLPDAPPGTAGISMFVVPKFLPDAEGTPRARNRVVAAGVENKLGLHGSPTCTMVYDQAVGFLVGEENRGLACMFTMMNLARLSVGIQGVGVAERAYQTALAYARERRQGRGFDAERGPSPIVAHPDVQMMLLRMAALVAASRSLCYACAHAIDMSRRGPANERGAWADRASLLTPVAKAFSTDAAIEVASLGIQVHGGAGYIEETGAAQHLRDARIFAIYEGTNGIQAIDLVTRKLGLRDGAAVTEFTAELRGIADALAMSNRPGIHETVAPLRAAISELEAATAFMSEAAARDRRSALYGASGYLRLFGIVGGAALLAKSAIVGGDDRAGLAAIAKGRFFAQTMLPEASSLRAAMMGAGTAVGADGAALLDMT
ncbi:MAG TPA: acyl-CoA dehydrogenase [Bauldia sp.]|nr:acyl-CoA dehydrogenase [Bauldia sp.]